MLCFFVIVLEGGFREGCFSVTPYTVLQNYCTNLNLELNIGVVLARTCIKDVLVTQSLFLSDMSRSTSFRVSYHSFTVFRVSCKTLQVT